MNGACQTMIAKRLSYRILAFMRSHPAAVRVNNCPACLYTPTLYLFYRAMKGTGQMQQLALKQRPARRLVFRGTLWLAFVTLVMIALGAGATAADSKHHIDFLIYASIALLIWTCSAAELYIDRDYNRSLPGRLETYLNSNLDQDDYEQLRQAALRHPALRPWISDCIKNGELTYRDAEPLVARINQHLSENPSPSEHPHALLNSQQKLLQLLQLRSLVSTPPCESPAVVTVRSDTSGSSRISVCHADSGDSPIT